MAGCSTGFSTGVAKKELSIANPMAEKSAKLDRDTFGVAVGQGLWQRRLEEIGGIKPLAFGQFGWANPRACFNVFRGINFRPWSAVRWW
jgi:hypothetical protein